MILNKSILLLLLLTVFALADGTVEKTDAPEPAPQGGLGDGSNQGDGSSQE